MNQKATYTVKRLRLLQYLVSRGFKDYTVIPDPTSSKNYNWFIFENSDALQEAINNYFANHLRGHEN
jgi:hypothetical protein